jgi:diketogulonate reductase-like aldo/keto reductase
MGPVQPVHRDTVPGALMKRKALLVIFLFAFELGINLWDTALEYGIHSHVGEALSQEKRSDVVVTTKLITPEEKETLRDYQSVPRE